jgi:hypothetical protein
MSKRNTSRTGSTVQSILRDFKTMSRADFLDMYNIVINSDDSVSDLVYLRSFNSIQDWAVFSAEQDADDMFDASTKFTKGVSEADYW